MERRKNRSDSYQHLLLEIAYSHDMMAHFKDEDSIQGRLNPYAYNEDLIDLEDELKKEFWRVVNTCLTKRQKEVIRLYADGYTQMEIAKILNVNQSSINKSLNGNVDYKKGRHIYGGSRKRIKKIIENDEKIISILNKIKNAREEKW